MNTPKLLLFDLGGVLVKLTGVPRMLELTRHRYTIPELWEKWLHSPTIRLYESGKMSTREFGRSVVEEFDIAIPPERYLAEFTVWPEAPYPGIGNLLSELKRKCTLASLSNTNELHWNRVCEEMHFVHLFDFNFPSHLTGRLKPDRATYLHVAETTGIRPADILFFDDNAINVDGAKSAGLDAVCVDGIESLSDHLAAAGFLYRK